MSADTKIFLIGLDGASWKVIRPLIGEHRLPHLEQLMHQGVYGTIGTLDDKVSPIIWTTVATGMTPENHGIDGFMKCDIPGEKPVPYGSADWKAKALWHILTEQDKRVGVYSWLYTWPPEAVNGFMFSSNSLTDSLQTASIVPETLRSLLPPYGGQTAAPADASELDEFLHGLQCRWSYDAATVPLLLGKDDYRLFAFYTPVLDHAQHLFWKFMHPERYRDASWGLTGADIVKYGNTITDFYEKMDALIGIILQYAGANSIVIVASDHGAADMPVHYTPVDFGKVAAACGWSDRIRVFFCEDGKNWTYVATDLSRDAFENLISGIRTESGKPVYRITASDRKGFDYALMQDMSDVLPHQSIYVQSKRYPASAFLDTRKQLRYCCGNHDYHDGIFLMSGNHVLRDVCVSDASVFDIAPTILYLLGMSVPRDMAGKVLAGAIEPEYVQRHPVKFTESYGKRQPSPAPRGPEGSPGDGGELLKKLKTLGYLG